MSPFSPLPISSETPCYPVCIQFAEKVSLKVEGEVIGGREIANLSFFTGYWTKAF